MRESSPHLQPVLPCGWLAAISIAGILAGCQPDVTATAVPTTPEASARPSATPAPSYALDRAAIWIAAEGTSKEIVTVTADGDTETIPLPLNADQQAVNLVASLDGEYLGYLVVTDEGAQKGIASWKLTEPSARLIVQPLPGYRIIALLYASDGESLVFVQVDDDDPSNLLWRIESIASGGGSTSLLADQASTAGITWPLPIGWQADGPVMLLASAEADAPISQGVRSGVFTLDTASGEMALATPPEDVIVLDALISPDGDMIAYTPGTADGKSSVVRVYDRSSDLAITITPPGGGVAISMAWYAQGRYLLVDMLATPSEAASQTWAKVEIGREPPWPQNAADPSRADLFTYAPYNDGVIYTLYRDASEASWTLYVLPEISGDVSATSMRLPRAGEGAPRIVYTPQND
jgi:hypothetical protein